MDGVLEKLEKEIFPKNRQTVFGYMPADGNDPKPKFTPFWENLAHKHNAEFIYIDNSREPSPEMLQNLNRINSLTITGGNVFAMLHNLRQSGLDMFILEKTNDKNFIYSGFSAGAIVATPDARIAAKENGWSFGYDENSVGITDTRALGLVYFEILPHYKKELDEKRVKTYTDKYKTEVMTLTDADFIIMRIDGSQPPKQ